MSDPVTTELIRSALQYAAEEMGLAVRNAAYSPNIKERLDHSCAIFDAVESLHLPAGVPIILTSPQGRLFSQAVAHELAAYPRLVLICGHYEGVDERVCEHLVTDEISIGDYVLSGGEIPAMVIADAVARLLPGAMDVESGREESHAAGLLEYPQYTRPAVYRGWEVPPILLSGHHGEIARWRRLQALRRTFERRPDLLATAPLSAAERALVRAWQQEQAGSDVHARS